jgi:hypothetical protein
MRTLVLLGTVSVFMLGCHHTGGGGDMGDDMSVSTDDLGDQSDFAQVCQGAGAACTDGTQCCSGLCDPNAHACTEMNCGQAGATCTTAADCCGLACTNKACGGKCTSDNQPCTANGDCCSTICGTNGMCTPLNTTCKTAGNNCSNGSECCSSVCNAAGQCAVPSAVSYCVQVGDLCKHNEDCCTGVCTLASGQTVGTCSAISTSCQVDGTLCNGCGACCSRFCGPFAPGGPAICQPASGCHVQGDLCHQDSDCCGGDPKSGLPGAGLIKCNPDPTYGGVIGTCGNPMASNCPPNTPTCKNSCDPEGNVCHQTNTVVCQGGTTNVRNDCCACVSGKDCCQPDKTGIPRCNALTACVMPGGSCSFSGECCNGLPCVPDSTGALHCGAMCHMSGQTCTTNADCCTGLVCTVPPGSLSGTCGTPTQGGSTDMATSMCAQYGQTCSTTIPCCNSVPCTATGGGACTASSPSCSCFSPIP